MSAEISPLVVINAVASHFGLNPVKIRGVGRDRFHDRPRQIAMYLVRRLCNLTYQEIGAIFSGRHHATIISAVDMVSERLSSGDKETCVAAGELLRQLDMLPVPVVSCCPTCRRAFNDATVAK